MCSQTDQACEGLLDINDGSKLVCLEMFAFPNNQVTRQVQEMSGSAARFTREDVSSAARQEAPPRARGSAAGSNAVAWEGKTGEKLLCLAREGLLRWRGTSALE